MIYVRMCLYKTKEKKKFIVSIKKKVVIIK